jgi:CopG family nickel-responsive transcriptional regulator
LTADVRQFADALMAERGVHHGQLNLIALKPDHTHTHSHTHDGQPHSHFGPSS